jgi:uncharacterized membrane protein
MHHSRSAAALRQAFIVASAGWAAVLAVSTYAGTHHPSTVVSLSVAAVYAIGSAVCHQLPARSFHLWGAQLPVCARCTGIYVGAALASLLSPSYEVSAFRRTLTARLALCIAALPTLATLAYEWTTGAAPSNTIRALAGLPLGAAVAAVVLSAADNQVN